MKATRTKPIEVPHKEEPPSQIIQPDTDDAPPPDDPTVDDLPPEATPPDKPAPAGVKAIALPPEPSAPDPVHPREERVRTLRDCARDLFVENGGTAEAFERLSKDEFETWVRRARE